MDRAGNAYSGYYGGAAVPQRVPSEQPPAPKEHVDKSPKTHAVPKQKAQIKWYFLLCTSVVFAMAILFIYQKSVYQEEIKEASRLKREIALSIASQQSIQNKIDNQMSLEDIEDYVVNKLGMIKIKNENIEYITTEVGDNIVVEGKKNAESKSEPSIIEKIIEFFR